MISRQIFAFTAAALLSVGSNGKDVKLPTIAFSGTKDYAVYCQNEGYDANTTGVTIPYDMYEHSRPLIADCKAAAGLLAIGYGYWAAGNFSAAYPLITTSILSGTCGISIGPALSEEKSEHYIVGNGDLMAVLKTAIDFSKYMGNDTHVVMWKNAVKCTTLVGTMHTEVYIHNPIGWKWDARTWKTS